jgi:beta-lactamase superfamily II metal-dependent hydrolase
MAGRKRHAASIRIRMYRVGFGDCFLVSFPDDQHVLVDCGVHVSGDIGTLSAVLDDIVTETGRRLAMIVVSHAHEDHISGFLRGEAIFRNFEIGEIWLPWTEDKDDELARTMRQRRAEVTDALQQHFAANRGAPDVLAVVANAAAASRNSRALDNLRDAFGTDARVRYIDAGRTIDEPGGVVGLKVRPLGPPRDESSLGRMNPPKPERYFRAAAGGGNVASGPHPFGPEHDADGDDAGPRLDERQRRALVRATELSPEALAFALDRAINNTSLVLLFTYRGRSLLFPGDAQFGAWKSWLDDDWSAETLSGLSFYKVAHHGSENATPWSALEGMPTGAFVAMLSTQSHPWPSIPYGKLMAALDRQTNGRVLRSDSIAIAKAPEGPPLALPPDFTKGPFWIDYLLPL